LIFQDDRTALACVISVVRLSNGEAKKGSPLRKATQSLFALFVFTIPAKNFLTRRLVHVDKVITVDWHIRWTLQSAFGYLARVVEKIPPCNKSTARLNQDPEAHLDAGAASLRFDLAGFQDPPRGYDQAFWLRDSIRNKF
jgi:hypothetical protein